MGDADREFESDYANFVLNPDPEDLLEQVDLERKRAKENPLPSWPGPYTAVSLSSGFYTPLRAPHGCDCMAVNLPAVDGHCPICRRPK